MEQIGRILLVASGKGGAGKSTFSVHCGTELAKRGHKVLLVDADAGLRSLDLMLSVADKAIFDLDDVLSARCEPQKAVLKTNRENLYLLPAPQTDCVYMADKSAVSRLYSELASYYDYIIVDSPAGVGDYVTAPAEVANCAIVVANADPVCIRSAERLSQILREKKTKYLRLVLNRIDAKLIRKNILPDLDTAIDRASVQLIGIIPEDRRILTAAAEGEPLTKGRAAQAFKNIAARIDGENVPLMKL
ncbi:MAG TPA: P-loop NTPase [Ruminiclostridium sp.]|nr:P-loop NTPase [Ruminiclostridium sp.]